MEELKNILSKEDVVTNITELDKDKLYLFCINKECLSTKSYLVTFFKDWLEKNDVKYCLMGDGLISGIYELDPKEVQNEG